MSFIYDYKNIGSSCKIGEESITFSYGYPYNVDDCYKFWGEGDKLLPGFKKVKGKFKVRK